MEPASMQLQMEKAIHQSRGLCQNWGAKCTFEYLEVSILSTWYGRNDGLLVHRTFTNYHRQQIQSMKLGWSSCHQLPDLDPLGSSSLCDPMWPSSPVSGVRFWWFLPIWLLIEAPIRCWSGESTRIGMEREDYVTQAPKTWYACLSVYIYMYLYMYKQCNCDVHQ